MTDAPWKHVIAFQRTFAAFLPSTASTIFGKRSGWAWGTESLRSRLTPIKPQTFVGEMLKNATGCWSVNFSDNGQLEFRENDSPFFFSGTEALPLARCISSPPPPCQTPSFHHRVSRVATCRKADRSYVASKLTTTVCSWSTQQTEHILQVCLPGHCRLSSVNEAKTC